MAEDGARVLVVVSALSGVTNELQAIANAPTGADDSIADRIAALVERHRAFCAELDLDADAVLGERLRVLQSLGTDARAAERLLDWQAEVLAQGELLSSTLGAAYLRSQGHDFGWCDARQWLDAVSLPNASAWAQRLSVNCRHNSDATFVERFAAQAAPMLLTQGFIARHGDGGTAILGRGGSDTSAAYFGALLKAQARRDLDRRARHVHRQSARSARCAPADAPGLRRSAGNRHHRRQGAASALDRALPRRRCADGDPRHRTLRPAGHAHRRARPRRCPGVKAISRRNGIVLVSMESIGMWQQVGFLADVFERFKRHGLSVDLIGSSETNVTVSLDPSENLVNYQRPGSA